MSKKHILGVVFVFLSAVIFGFTPVLANLSYSGGNNGVNMAFLRALLPLPVLFALGWGRGKSAKPTVGQIRRGILVGVLQFGCTLMLYCSYSYISVGVATTLHFLYPLFVVGWNALSTRRMPGKLKLAGLLLGVTGAASLIELGEGGMSPVGVTLALLSGVVFAAYIIAVQKEGQQPLPLYQLMTVLSLTGVVMCGGVGLAMGKITFRLTPQAWGYAAACALLVSIGGSALFQAGIRRVGDADAAIYSLLEPLTSIVFGVLLLGEALTVRKGFSSALILLGLLLTALADRPKKK